MYESLTAVYLVYYFMYLYSAYEVCRLKVFHGPGLIIALAHVGTRNANAIRYDRTN